MGASSYTTALDWQIFAKKAAARPENAVEVPVLWKKTGKSGSDGTRGTLCVVVAPHQSSFVLADLPNQASIMNKNRSFKSIIVAAALVAGFAVSAQADNGLPAQPAPDASAVQGLLGQSYATLTYTYINLDGVSSHADDYQFAANLPVSAGLDGLLSYDFVDHDFGHSNVLMAGLRAFSSRFNWGKPYVEAGAGFAWTSGDDSFVWNVATGIEFQVARQATLTPFIEYTDAPDLAGDGSWNFGAKGNYWVNPQWAVTVSVEIDDDNNTGFTVGTNFRF